MLTSAHNWYVRCMYEVSILSGCPYKRYINILLFIIIVRKLRFDCIYMGTEVIYSQTPALRTPA